MVAHSALKCGVVALGRPVALMADLYIAAQLQAARRKQLRQLRRISRSMRRGRVESVVLTRFRRG